MITVATSPVLAFPMSTVDHVDRAIELDMKQRIDGRITNQIGTSPFTTIPSVWTTLGTVFLPKETATAIPTGPGVDI